MTTFAERISAKLRAIPPLHLPVKPLAVHTGVVTCGLVVLHLVEWVTKVTIISRPGIGGVFAMVTILITGSISRKAGWINPREQSIFERSSEINTAPPPPETHTH